jgi:hypothetical protein
MIVRRCLAEPGIRVVCAREIQKTLAESAKRLIEDSIAALGVGHMFNIQHDKIITPGDGVINFWGLADKNAESIGHDRHVEELIALVSDFLTAEGTYKDAVKRGGSSSHFGRRRG